MSHNSNINFKDLEGLNIENLFPSQNGNRSYTNGKLDINTLFGSNNDSTKFTFDSRMLLDSIRRKKEKVLKCNQNFYEACCNTIMSANKVGTTDIIYEVPKYVADCQGYDSLNCLLYIRQKLREQNITCSIQSNVKIFITWNDIEKKLSNKTE